MQIVATFDPASASKGTFNLVFSAGNRGKTVVWNESATNLTLTFANGYVGYVPAWMAVLYCIYDLRSPVVTWAQQSMLGGSNSTISQVVVETYEDHEPVPGTFPASLIRQSNIGNTVSTTGGTATSIQNDNNPTGTSVVEATVSGDGTSAVSIGNQGQVVFGSNNNNGRLQVRGVTNANRDIIADSSTGVLTVQFSIAANLINTITGNDFVINAETNHHHFFQINQANVVEIDANGITLLVGTINLLHGSVSRLSTFSANGTAGKNTVNHNLGAVPDFIILTPNINSSPSAVALGYNTLTLTSTQVDVWQNINFSWVGLAVKF